MHRAAGGNSFSSHQEVLNVPANTLKTWRRRGFVPFRFLSDFARRHNTTLDYLAWGDEVQNEPGAPVMMRDQKGQVTIPRYSVNGSAGPGDEVFTETVVNFLPVSDAFVREVLRADAADLAIIGVDGSSMAPTLEHGDAVIVDRSIHHLRDSDVYLIRHQGKLRIKRLQMKMDGSVTIRSDNPSYEAETLHGDALDELQVVGRVLPWKFGRFKL